MIDPQIKEWATPRQREYIDAVIEHGTNRKAAAALGVARQVVDEAILRAKKSAAQAGYSPEHDMQHTVPDGYKVRGVSTYYNKEGKPAGQWVKSSADDARRMELLKEAVAAMAEEIPRVSAMPEPTHTVRSLCNVYTITDAHVGMLAWHKEGGADWDLKIAESTLTGCFESMVGAAPLASTCVVNQLGDLLHYDGLAPVTPTNGHILDSDGRFGKMVAVAIRILRRIVDFALAKHSKVILVVAEGNHDLASSVWIRHLFKALYEDEPRVEVVDSELPYYVYQHGQTMLAFHHGHLKGNSQLPLFFAAQFPAMWGVTTKRYAHIGHRHHVETKEHSGLTTVQHSTLAARDAYAARGGWMSERQVTAYTYHDVHGQVASVTITPEMLDKEAA